jgi:hypothetical protein
VSPPGGAVYTMAQKKKTQETFFSFSKKLKEGSLC